MASISKRKYWIDPATGRRGIHTRPNTGKTNEWLTPPEILLHLGRFDLDPCSPASRPWDTAAKH